MKLMFVSLHQSKNQMGIANFLFTFYQQLSRQQKEDENDSSKKISLIIVNVELL